MDKPQAPQSKESADYWVKMLNQQAEVLASSARIMRYIEALRMLVQSGKDELGARGFPDTIGGSNLDVGQQFLTLIEQALPK